jgi:preprotein translocase subunit SecG
MALLINVLIILASVLLILVVLVQNSKGGGLASNFSGAGQVMSVRKQTDVLEKATWGLAIGLVVLSLMSSVAAGGGSKETNKSAIEQQIMSEQPVVPSGFAPIQQQPAE